MASGPITSWQTDGETVETVADFIFWPPKSLLMEIAAMKLKDLFLGSRYFFWNSLAFSMIQQMLEIWALVPLPFLKPDWTSGSSWFMYYWSPAWRILSITLLTCEMSAISALMTMAKSLTAWITINCGKFWKIWEYQTTWPASWEICMQVRKQQF